MNISRNRQADKEYYETWKPNVTLFVSSFPAAKLKPSVPTEGEDRGRLPNVF